MAFTYCTNCGEKIDDSVERCPHCNHPKGVDRVYGYTSENFGKKENTEQQGQQENKNPWEGGQNPNSQNGAQGSPYENGNASFGGQNGNPYNGGQNPNGGTQNPWENGQNPYGQNGNPYGNGQSRNPWEGSGGPYGQGGPWQNPNGGMGGGPYYGGNAPWQPRERRNLSVGLIVFSIINILLGTCCAGSIFGIIGLVFAITARDAATEEEEIRRKKISLAINIIAVVLTVAFIISFAIGFFQAGGIEAFLQ